MAASWARFERQPNAALDRDTTAGLPLAAPGNPQVRIHCTLPPWIRSPGIRGGALASHPAPGAAVDLWLRGSLPVASMLYYPSQRPDASSTVIEASPAGRTLPYDILQRLDPGREPAPTARLGEPSAHLHERLTDRVQRHNKDMSTRLSALRRRLRNRPTGMTGRGRAA